MKTAALIAHLLETAGSASRQALLGHLASQHSHGCDWSAPGRIIARGKGMQLVWRRGRRYFAGIGIQNYAPPDLHILFDGKHAGNKMVDVTHNHRTYLERGSGHTERLCKATILKYKDVIDQHFGAGAAEKISALEKTVVFDK